jgi:hypothetical protein
MVTMSKYLKTCKGCNKHKSLDSFGKNKSSKDGLQTRCKTCFKNYKQKPRLIKSQKLEGVIPKPKFNREQLLKQISKLRQRESDPNIMSGYNYDFLWTNKKFNE